VSAAAAPQKCSTSEAVRSSAPAMPSRNEHELPKAAPAAMPESRFDSMAFTLDHSPVRGAAAAPPLHHLAGNVPAATRTAARACSHAFGSASCAFSALCSCSLIPVPSRHVAAAAVRGMCAAKDLHTWQCHRAVPPVLAVACSSSSSRQHGCCLHDVSFTCKRTCAAHSGGRGCIWSAS
jgi:hypothetical protein